MTTLKAALQDAYFMELEEIPSDEILSEDDTLTFSSAFERKMKKLIRRADHPVRHRIAQAAACLLLLALLSGCTVLAVSPEARAAFVGWIRETYESWFVYRYSGEEQPTLEDTVYSPAWVPEGYEEITAPQAGTYIYTQYENSKQELLTVSYLKGTEKSSLNVEWEGAIVQKSFVGGLSADLYLNPDGGPNILVWTDYGRDAAFWITAPLSEKELVKVAESIQESGPMPKRYCISLLPLNYGAYSIASEVEEYGWGETVYENDQGFFVTFGYSNDPASAPHPQGESTPVHVGDLEGTLYPALEANGDKTLLWFTEEGNALWVKAPLPDDELHLIAENVIVQANRFPDLIEYQVFDDEAPLLECVEQVLTNSFMEQIKDCARRDAQTGNRMSEEYNTLWKEQQAQYVSPERDRAIARVSALTDALWREGRSGECIVNLFGPFYTASIYVSEFDYETLDAYDLLEYHYGATAHIVDERGVLIAGYHIKSIDGSGESIIVPTAEEQQFEYVVRQIYIEAYQKALSTLSNKE